MKRQLVTALLVGTIVSAVFVTEKGNRVLAADISSDMATTDTAEAAVTEDNTATATSGQDTATVASTQEDAAVKSTEKSSSDYYMTVDPTPDNEALRKKYAAARKYEAQWQKYNYQNGAYRSWVYMLSDGTYPRNENYTVDGVTYYFNANGEATGWFIAYGNIYYAGSDGRFVTGEQTIDGKKYTFSQSGVLEEGTVTIGGKEYTKGKTEEQPEEKKSGWEEKDGKKFYYEDGEIIKSTWKNIDGNRYYFEKDGTMARWKWIGDYYVGSTGAMVRWRWIGDYYLGSTGVKAKSQWIGDCYVDRYGTRLKSQWIGDYYVNQYGMKVRGWQWIGGNRYYFDNTGAMVRWRWIDDYYVGSTGAMVRWRWIGDYYLGSTGKKAKSQWIGNYYVNSYGAKVRGWQQINGQRYYFDSTGCVVKNTTKTIDGKKYIFDSNGVAREAKNNTGSNYKVTCHKNSKTVQVYEKQNGKWVSVKSGMKCSVGSIKNGKSITPTGSGRIVYKKYKMKFAHTSGFYVSWTNRGVGFHTFLFKQSASAPTTNNIADSRLGLNISKGCIRLSIANAKWIYDNVPVGADVSLENN